MRPGTRDLLVAHWVGRLGLRPGQIVVRDNTDCLLGGADTVVVLEIPDATVVRCPAPCVGPLTDRVDGASLLSSAWWRAASGLAVADTYGPVVHSYLDDDAGLPLPDPRVRITSPRELAGLRDEVAAHEWAAAGIDVNSRALGILGDGGLLAAVQVHPWAGLPGDVGLVVRPDQRRVGLGRIMAAVGARWAISDHGVAVLRYHATDRGSQVVAGLLGFTEFGAHLFVHLEVIRYAVRRR